MEAAAEQGGERLARPCPFCSAWTRPRGGSGDVANDGAFHLSERELEYGCANGHEFVLLQMVTGIANPTVEKG